MSTVKSRKGTRPQARSKSYRPFQPSTNYHAHSVKDAKGSEYLNHEISNEHLIASFLVLVGCPVQVQTVQGVTYEGIFETISPKLEIIVKSVHLRSERKLKKQDLCNVPNKENVFETMSFQFSDVVCMNCAAVDIDYAKRDCLMTDSGISGNGLIKRRELKKWEGSEESHGSGASLSLEDGGGMRNGWDWDDMIRVNEEKYGVKSSFDSSMSSYMSEIEYKDTEEYREKELKAQRIAHEIENDVTCKEHDEIDSGISEEDMFSAVMKQETQNSYQRSYVPPRTKKNVGARVHPGPDYHGKTMPNSHQKRSEGDKPLYSQLVKKSIPQPKPQELAPRGSSGSSPRTASPTYQPTMQPPDDHKTKIVTPQPGTQAANKKTTTAAPPVQHISQPQTVPSGSSHDVVESLPSNGFDKQIDSNRLKQSNTMVEVNGKGSESKRKEITDKVKFGRVIPTHEFEEPVDIESLKKFHEYFKLPENGSNRKDRVRSPDVEGSSKPAEIHSRNETKHTIATADAPVKHHMNDTPDYSKEKGDSIQPKIMSEEPRLPTPRAIEEQVIEVETTTNVSSEPYSQPSGDSATSSNRVPPVVDTHRQEPVPPSQKEIVDDAKVDVKKSTLNPLAEEFDPRKKRIAVSPQVPQPVSLGSQHSVYSSSPSPIQVSHIQGNMIHTSQGGTVVGPRPHVMSAGKRVASGRVIVGAVQDPSGAVVPGNSVPAYIQNNPPVVLMQPNHYHHQGQVISMPLPQHPQPLRYVINTNVNQPSGVHQGMNVGSGYQDSSQAVFLGSQGNQVMPPSVMTVAQPGYSHNPSNQPGLPRYVLPFTGHSSPITSSMPPSQQGGTPGPPQMHPHAVHPQAQQQRHQYVFFQHPPSMGMQASQIVTGQPHPAGMQNYQHPS